jgi:hypothetical protein
MARGSEPGQVRASGETAARETADEQEDTLGTPEEATEPIEESLDWQFTNFHRMRTSWNDEDHATISRINSAVEERVFEMFTDAFEVMNGIWGIVRLAEEDGDGKPVLDRHGYPVWQRTLTGAYIEDWSRLTYAQRENFLYTIVTNQFLWEQRSASVWAEAMMAKAMFTEHFSHAFDRPEGRMTVEARTARGNLEAAEDRYFALFVSALSKRADALVRSMDRLAMRLRDSLSGK